MGVDAHCHVNDVVMMVGALDICCVALVQGSKSVIRRIL